MEPLFIAVVCCSVIVFVFVHKIYSFHSNGGDSCVMAEKKSRVDKVAFLK